MPIDIFRYIFGDVSDRRSFFRIDRFDTEKMRVYARLIAIVFERISLPAFSDRTAPYRRNRYRLAERRTPVGEQIIIAVGALISALRPVYPQSCPTDLWRT
nr:hypothetical protein [Salinisphaera shabanensis]